MSAKILDGKKLSSQIKLKIFEEIKELKLKNITPGLAVIIVGEDKASKIYVRNKEKACQEVGIVSQKFELPETTSENEILELIKKLNTKEDIHGILVQLPLPKHIDENKIINLISKNKDVDGFHPYNLGNIMIGRESFVSCTPQGILELIKSENIAIAGKECVIVGSSNIVGKPMAMMMINNNATVTVCNIFTKDLESHCRRADILIVAVGKEKLITASMVKKGAVVIDVGINKNKDGHICRDVDFESVSKIAGYITPVPGGVGPMTIAILLQNTVLSAKEFYKF
ncbi:MAG: bifunctional methylenetetrahydrofolate dehydrogenase/methenyltetrahydrofolate cyclohydrolase FolD [Oscillospiraceae bacterium]|nr:bifunctional methylenetetrahydrofolate dehydrogenase/methenyltetrahydrofolate cyclohydrolase FolD [Oscillospiraceae bacterium]